MSGGVQFQVTRGHARRGFVVLAFLALSLILARPICDVYRLQGGPSHHEPVAAADHALGETSHGEESAPCCASMEDGALTVAATAATPSANPPAPFLAATVSLPGWRAAVALFAAAIPPDRPPDFQPYHARSARILI